MLTVSGEGKKLTVMLKEPVPVNQIVLSEDIRYGERVRAFRVEGLVHGYWKTLFEGSCIGHKLIIPFHEVSVSKMRLRILKYSGEPRIKEFSLYYVNK